jgi:hypothetical protein
MRHPQKGAHQSLSQRLERYDVLTVRRHQTPDRNQVHAADRFAHLSCPQPGAFCARSGLIASEVHCGGNRSAGRRTQTCLVTCIRPLKHAARLLAVGAVLVKCQRVPFAALGGKEIAAIDMDCAGELIDRVND